MARIFRTRYIPSETLDLSQDELLYRDENYLITRWLTIRPKEDILGGISCVFLKKGWKISALINHENNLDRWYCDIVDIDYEKETDTYYLYDLLADVAILLDGQIRVLDLDELAIAFEQRLITEEQLKASLLKCSELLKLVYSEDVPKLVRKIILDRTGIGV